MRSHSITRRADEALPNFLADDAMNFESMSSSEEDEGIGNRIEDEHPQVEKVIGCRKTCTRYNSTKVFIYTFHKQT